MNKHIQRLFLFEKFEIQTKLSKRETLKRIRSFVNSEYTDYYGSISEDGFFVAEKNRKYFIGGYSHNSFAPIAKAKINENGDITTVSIVLRMNLFVFIPFAPIYFISMLFIVPFPFVLILVYFSFMRPAKRLKEALEDLLTEN